MREGGARLLAVNVVYEIRRGPTRDTAIDKRPVDGPVEVGELGLSGDTQCDRRHHGGADRALYAYASEDAAWWATELDRAVTPGLFGENLTTVGVDITHACIGERWRIGPGDRGVVVEVRMPRTPCDNLSARMGLTGFHKRFNAAGRVGAYLKVHRPGVIAAGAPIAVVYRPEHGVTVEHWCGHRTVERARDLLGAEIDLAADVRRTARRKVSRGLR